MAFVNLTGNVYALTIEVEATLRDAAPPKDPALRWFIVTDSALNEDGQLWHDLTWGDGWLGWLQHDELERTTVLIDHCEVRHGHVE